MIGRARPDKDAGTERRHQRHQTSGNGKARGYRQRIFRGGLEIHRRHGGNAAASADHPGWRRAAFAAAQPFEHRTDRGFIVDRTLSPRRIMKNTARILPVVEAQGTHTHLHTLSCDAGIAAGQQEKQAANAPQHSQGTGAAGL